MTQISLRVKMDDEDDLAAAREAAANAPEIIYQEQIESPREDDEDALSPLVEPVSCILIAGGVIAAVSYIRDWLDKRKGGLVVDQRPGAEYPIARTRNLPWGYVLVYPPDGGEVKIDTKDAPKDEWERLLTSIISIAEPGAATAGKAVKALGAGKVTSVSPGS
jgi:hypothetical protein